ncbi:type II/IV secretion system protein [Flavobacterium sp. MAH-1]|uniref:Type II/IV secretion system protein n=1 Tax=Flavobacterium agri TaxID=2743471 RepID=A0A7Y9C4G6_9FLAO|nr:GspE/PulE family protein [Flavobacterium agri]NUY79265.1 type II/IV secretion system protein [Flavobacterium agri]NYA69289.1 type II/IV secretion system protein [Flavobacterium agri]
MDEIIITEDNRHAISNYMANSYKILPQEVYPEALVLYCAEKTDYTDITDELELLLGKKVTFTPYPSHLVEKALSRYYRQERQELSRTLNLEKGDFLEELLAEAKSLKSSDIHCEVYENSARVRLRVDGQLLDRYKLDRDSYQELVNKIKIMAKLNITEKRLPQDGRITTPAFDIRVSILPTLFGEKIVMRLLGQDASKIDLDTLGFEPEALKEYLEAIRKPNGIILISGPTGSGKTTTLYATLRLLNDSRRNILTVEDPIEYILKGINQVQLKEDIGLTFSAALRSFLRQDPDIIMLGEIRDAETALMAIRASLTGHLVLSTIHTNSALGTVSRLVDMGVPAYLIAETLNLSVAQRLIRKLCPDCKEEIPYQPEDFPGGFRIPYEPDRLFRAKGCNNCFHTGYKGRRALYEIVRITPQVSDAIKTGALDTFLENKEEYKSLSEKAFDVLGAGETSLEEIYSILLNA